MIDTEKRVETGFDESVTTNHSSLFEPNFKPFTFSSSVPVQSVEPETAFEVEKQYTPETNGYDYNRSYQEEMSMPTVERTVIEEPEAVIETKPQPQVAPRIRLNARGKIIVSVYAIIVAIIVAFMIYNTVSINSLQADLASKSQIVITETEIVDRLQETYDNLGENNSILSQVEGEFKVPTEADTVHMNNFELSERTKPVKQTNWFDRFCRSLLKLFN